MNGHSAASMAQTRYSVRADAMDGVKGMQNYAGPDTPVPHKAGTVGSVNQRIVWRSPEGAGLSAQSMGSTLFDNQSSAAQMPRPQGS